MAHSFGIVIPISKVEFLDHGEIEDYGLPVKLHCLCMVRGVGTYGLKDKKLHHEVAWHPSECRILTPSEVALLKDYHSRICINGEVKSRKSV